MKKIIALFLIVLIFASCSPERIAPEEYLDDDTWLSLFEAYWHGMNDNYMFWNLDSPSSEWDDVHDEYGPRFEALGKISKDNILDGYQYFFDISENLSDGHYQLTISTDQGPLFQYYPSVQKILRDIGYQDRLESCIDKDYLLESDYLQHEILAENTWSIISRTFGLDVSNNFYLDSPEGKLSEYFAEAEVFSSSDFQTILGKTEDGILYFAFSSFDWTKFLHQQPVRKILGDFNDQLISADIRGVIIDLRGNSGGYNNGFPLVWSRLVSEPTLYMFERTKYSDNRLDYTPYVPNILYPDSNDGHINEDIPIVVIVNGGTGSNGEISLFLFDALRKEGRDIEIIGNATFGATGSYTSNYVYNSGGFDLGVINVTSACVEHVDCDKNSIEGTGFEPDILISFDYNAFSLGDDQKLNKAFDLIRSKI